MGQVPRRGLCRDPATLSVGRQLFQDPLRLALRFPVFFAFWTDGANEIETNNDLAREASIELAKLTRRDVTKKLPERHRELKAR